jgi:putative transposase
MVHYRRNVVVGGTYFFTVTLRNRRCDLLVRHVGLLREAWYAARMRVPHEVIAAVVLPDHLHAVLVMRDSTSDYSRLWQDIKRGFTRRLAVMDDLPRRNGLPALWQSRFWEHTIKGADDLRAHVDYVHINPLKHGYVTRVADWPHSTFHRYVRNRDLPLNWAGDVTVAGQFGER